MSHIPGPGINNLYDRCAVCDGTTLIDEILAASNLRKLNFCYSLYLECKEHIHKIHRFIEVHACLLRQLKADYNWIYEQFKIVGANEEAYAFTIRLSFLRYIKRIKTLHSKVDMHLVIVNEHDQSVIASTMNTIRSLGFCGTSLDEPDEDMNGNPEEHIEEGAGLIQIEQGQMPILRPDYEQRIANFEDISLNGIENINGSYYISDQYVLENEENIPHCSSEDCVDYCSISNRSIEIVEDRAVMNRIPLNTPTFNESVKVEIPENLNEQKLEDSRVQQNHVSEKMVNNSINSKISLNGRPRQDCVEVDQRKFSILDGIKRNPQSQQINLNCGNRVQEKIYEKEQERNRNPMQVVLQKRQLECKQNQAFANNPRVPINRTDQQNSTRKMTNSNANKGDYYYNNNMISNLVSNGNDSKRMSTRPKPNPFEQMEALRREQNAKVGNNNHVYSCIVRKPDKNGNIPCKQNFTTKLESVLKKDPVEKNEEIDLSHLKDLIEKVPPKKKKNRKFYKQKKYQGNFKGNDKQEPSVCNKNKSGSNKNKTLQKDDRCEQKKIEEGIVIYGNNLSGEDLRKEKAYMFFFNCKNSLLSRKRNSESENDSDMNDTVNLNELRENLKLQNAHGSLDKKI